MIFLMIIIIQDKKQQTVMYGSLLNRFPPAVTPTVVNAFYFRLFNEICKFRRV